MSYISGIPTPNTENDRNESSTSSVQPNAAERGNGKSCKRDSSYLLVGKALEMELADKKPSSSENSGNFYDCNICLDMAKDPILTCCGHLFCWACFYKVSYVDSTSKECPVCKGEVTDSNVTPIYGNGNETRSSDSADDSKLPPRPKARRIESARQQNITQRGSNALNVPFAEAIRQIRSRIGGLVGVSRQQVDGDEDGSEYFTYAAALTDGPRLRRQVSTLRVLDVLEGYIQDDIPLVAPEIQIMDSRPEIESSSSSRRLDGLARVVSLENVASLMAGENESDAFAPARRRTRGSRVSDVEHGVLPDTRRRRLRR
jgi:hypothetical protein